MTDLLTPVDQFIREQQELTAVDRFSRLHDDDGLDVEVRSAPDRAAYRDLLPLVGSGRRAAVRVRGRPRRLLGVQGVRDARATASTASTRPRRGASVGAALGTDASRPSRRRHRARSAAPADRHHGVPPLRRPGLPQRLPGRRLREGPDHRHRRATSTTSASAAATARSCAPTRCRSTTTTAASCASATCAATGWPRARRRRACRRARPRPSASRSSTWPSSSAEARPRRRRPSRRWCPPRPPSSITVPTTRYRSRDRCPRRWSPADQFSLQPAHAHTPLAVMLVLTQLAVGAVRAGRSLVGDRLDARPGRGRRRSPWLSACSPSAPACCTSAARATPGGRCIGSAPLVAQPRDRRVRRFRRRWPPPTPASAWLGPTVPSALTASLGGRRRRRRRWSGSACSVLDLRRRPGGAGGGRRAPAPRSCSPR